MKGFPFPYPDALEKALGVLGWSNAELATRTELTDATIRRVLRREPVTREVTFAIVKALDTERPRLEAVAGLMDLLARPVGSEAVA